MDWRGRGIVERGEMGFGIWILRGFYRRGILEGRKYLGFVWGRSIGRGRERRGGACILELERLGFNLPASIFFSKFSDKHRCSVLLKHRCYMYQIPKVALNTIDAKAKTSIDAAMRVG